MVYFAAALLILIILKFPDAAKINDDYKEVAAVEQGIQLLKKYDGQDTEDVENEVRSIRAAAAERQAMAARAGQASDGVDLTTAFAGCIVMGDSQAEALEAYKVIPSQSVVATIGRSIITAQEDYTKTVGRSPEKVFITYGMNDCLIYSGNTEKFIAVYGDLIDRLEADIPGVQIYVCSIIVPSAGAIEKKPDLAGVSNYNVALQQLAIQKGLTYIDASALISDDLYASDGLHMKKSFYQSWAYYIATCAGLM